MKLSEVRGERVFDVIAEVIDPIVSIAQDENAAELFQPKELPKGMTPWEFFLQRARKSLPALVRDHKGEMAQIMACINGVTVEEYMEGLTLPKFFADLTELLTDREFTSFFA